MCADHFKAAGIGTSRQGTKRMISHQRYSDWNSNEETKDGRCKVQKGLNSAMVVLNDGKAIQGHFDMIRAKLPFTGEWLSQLTDGLPLNI